VVERFHDEGGPFLAENLRGECSFDVHTHPSQWTDVTISSFPDGSRLVQTCNLTYCTA
jgi:hypothetical protein